MAGRKDRDSLSWFADELRAHRAVHGWTQADVAAKTAYSESLIAQVETCRKAATPELAKALDRVFATPGFKEDEPGSPGAPGTFGRLVARLRNLPFPASFRSFAPHEAEAAALYVFEHSFVPGLLQTEEYARAVLMMHPDVTEDVVNERVAGRLARQAILDREDPPPPLLCALMDQSVLNREIGGPDVMRAQLVSLVAMSGHPNITVQIIPNTGAHPGLMGAFTVAESGGGPGIVNLEDIADGRVTEDAATVSMVAVRFHSLRGDALSKGGITRPHRRCDTGTMEGTSALTWRKSRYSGTSGGQCVEVAVSGHVLVRDTKDRAGGVLSFSAEAWRRFIKRTKDDAA